MAPVNEHCVTTVLTSSALSHEESTILVEAGGFAPMKWFLGHALNPAPEEQSGPPAKKRKLQFSESKSLRCETPEPAQHIPLSRVTVDLCFARSLDGRQAAEAEVKADVNLEGADSIKVDPTVIDRFGEHRLRLALPRVRGEVLVVDVTELPDHAREALRQAAVCRLRKASNSKSSLLAYWSRCTLTPSTGQLFSVVRLEITLFWRSRHSAFPSGVPTVMSERQLDYKMLFDTFPDSHRDEVDQSQPMTPQDFYESVHVPNKDQDTTKDFLGLLNSDLYPFQKRAVHWMLSREGVLYKQGRLHRLQNSQRDRDCDFYQEFVDADGDLCYVSHLQGIISRQRPDANPTRLLGGLLAEEMGLGKTVELAALLSVHKRPEPLPKAYVDGSGLEITPSRATLIIIPNTILQQWKSELARHAPALRVCHYEGVSSKKPEVEKTIEVMATEYDVVLSTYSTLTRELHFAEDPPDRDMRNAPKFERKRSPIVRLQWWRICLDEAQMVESGVSAAARVARRLPAVLKWVISGTPLKKNIQDLHGLLIFLDYKPLSEDTKLWNHLINNHKHLFRKVFETIALRHTKAQIREDIQLPEQKRVVVTIPFSATEEHNYAEMYNQMCKEVGVERDGSSTLEQWDPEDPSTIEKMRSWLTRLRQTCLHPQVGGHNRRALGRGRGPLRTVPEVLAVMLEQNATERRNDERALLASQLLRGHIVGNAQDNDRRSEDALQIYTLAMQRSGELVTEARQKLAEAEKREAEKGRSPANIDGEDAEESIVEVGRLRNSVRSALQLQHTCTFFAATACYQTKADINITEPDTQQFRDLEKQESALYERAKAVRREILLDSSRKSEALMRSIEGLVKQNTLTRIPSIKDLESLGGIESRRIVDKSDDLFNSVREQSKLVALWRAKMAEYLLKPLVDKDDDLETTGDEYEDSTKLQDELYVYFDALRALISSLNTCITGETAPLIDYEVQYAINAARTCLDPKTLDEHRKNVHAPRLTLELLGLRNKLRGDHGNLLSMRGLIQEARALEHSSHGQATGIRTAERAIARQHVNALQEIFNAHSKALAGIEKEVELFRSAQNQRLEFYRQLQELSDAVQPYKEELDQHLDLEALQKATEREQSHSKALKKLKSTSTFLLHLRESDQEVQEPCTICKETFLSGVLTVCGHKYCKECLAEWWKQEPSKPCAFCRSKLIKADLHDITYKPQRILAREEVESGTSSPSDGTSSSKSVSIYSGVDSHLLQEIKSIDLPISYGIKIDTLGRHLRWIRQHDPGAKSIVFSQYRDFLDVLSAALIEFKIGHSRLGHKGAVEKFKRDAAIDCLLLDAKTDSSGMTLVNATHVFICEPLIQTAVELQAIARVHRIGQTRSTTVWMYLVKDTVEEAIYDISVTRRLAHVQARQSHRAQKSRSATPAPLQENAIDAANSEEMQSAPLAKLLVAGKGGGEVVEKGDLWQCLFGKPQKPATVASVEEPALVARHRRAEAAEQRRADAMNLD